MGLFNPCMKIKIFLCQMYSFEVVNNMQSFVKFVCEVLLAPSMCLFRWINRIISKRAHTISKILFILGSKKFLACLKLVRSYAWSFSHSREPFRSRSKQCDLSLNIIKDCLRGFWISKRRENCCFVFFFSFERFLFTQLSSLSLKFQMRHIYSVHCIT